ncbi:MAG: MBL fold metallo-hydrolase, partial [Phototrophicaceae bacterium]
MPEIYLPCTLHRISEHIWWFTPDDHTDRPSLCAVVGSERVLLLDIGASIAHTQAFLNALAAQGIGAPDFAVLTHWHWDHVFGSDALTCPIIAHVETATNIERMMTLDYSDANLLNLVAEGHEVDFTREHMVLELSNQQRKNLTLRQPDVTFCSAITLHLGGVTCQIEHVGGDHASDAVVIYVQEDKLLFLGDCFYYTVYQ